MFSDHISFHVRNCFRSVHQRPDRSDSFKIHIPRLPSDRPGNRRTSLMASDPGSGSGDSMDRRTDLPGLWFLTAAAISFLLDSRRDFGTCFRCLSWKCVQGLYAAVIGLFLSWVMEKKGCFIAPWLVHVSANLTSVLGGNVVKLKEWSVGVSIMLLVILVWIIEKSSRLTDTHH